MLFALLLRPTKYLCLYPSCFHDWMERSTKVNCGIRLLLLIILCGGISLLNCRLITRNLLRSQYEGQEGSFRDLFWSYVTSSTKGKVGGARLKIYSDLMFHYARNQVTLMYITPLDGRKTFVVFWIISSNALHYSHVSANVFLLLYYLTSKATIIFFPGPSGRL